MRILRIKDETKIVKDSSKQQRGLYTLKMTPEQFVLIFGPGFISSQPSSDNGTINSRAASEAQELFWDQTLFPEEKNLKENLFISNKHELHIIDGSDLSV